MWKSHRVVYILCCDAELPDEGWMVCHHCDNTVCHNPSHLFAGTAMDNSEDMRRKGRQVRLLGALNPMWGKLGPMRGRTGIKSVWHGRKHKPSTIEKMKRAQRRRYDNERKNV